jgi:YD repeat-containing protein
MHVVRGGARLFLATSVCALATAAQAGETVTYTYDALGRLVATQSSGSVNNGVSTSVGYDPAGNRSTYTVSGSGSGSGPSPPPPGPAPAFSVSDASATEGDALLFTITRSGTTTGAFTLDYTTAGVTAGGGADYAGMTGTLSFASGEASKVLTVATIEDNVAEPTETVQMQISNASGGATISRPVGTGTIADDDGGTNSPPVANADSYMVMAGAAALLPVIENDSDPNGNVPLAVWAVSDPTRAYVANNGNVGWYAAPSGTYSFTYTVKNSLGASSTGTVTVTVEAAPPSCGMNVCEN